MIILEGTDSVGKTMMAQTLCEIVAGRTGCGAQQLYGHMSRPPDDFDHVSEYMRGVRLGVQDRYHLGSIVYGRILGGGTFPQPRKMRVVQAYLRWMGCHVVIVTCSRDSLRERLMKDVSRREEMYRVDQILDAGDAYAGLARSTNMGEPYCDELIDVTRSWPTRDQLSGIVDRWHQKFIL